ncbi:MAG: hypothetical protein PVG98_03190 [Chromatiales bacterium]
MPISALGRWRQRLARRAGRRADAAEERGLWRQWCLLLGPCARAALASPRPEALAPVYPPDGVLWADPFLWSRDGDRYVFVEELPYATGRGRISVIPIGADLRPAGPAVPVIEEPHHLSYPYLFEFEGQLYMAPEKQYTARVDIYRCAQFPHRWEPAGTLISGVRIADPTLFEHGGRWWLFCAVKRRGLRVSESLFAFHAESPLSRTWVPHPANPLVRDFSRARPAGRIQRDGEGRLLRPSQDCVRRYGHGLNLSEILELSPTRYRERPVWHRSGPEAGGWRAMHHMDWHEGIIAMDAQRLVCLPPAGP